MRNEKDIPLGALRIFLAAARAETLTAAAGELGITQSAVSQAIAQLEALSGATLVVRRSRPVRLTPAGQVMRDYASEIFGQTRTMLGAVRTAAGGTLPHLSVGMIDSFGDLAGKPLIERIGPQVGRLSLLTGYTAPLTQAFVDREIDILVTTDPLQEHADLERHPILRDPFVMLVAEQHAGQADVDIARLAADVPFVRYSRQSRLGMLTDLIARRLSIEPQVRYELDSTRTLLRFVQAGFGWAMATALCIVQHPDLLDGVRILPLGNSGNARHICLLARPDELAGLPVGLADTCREIYADEVLPDTLRLMPWLEPHARVITEMPII